MRSREIRYVLMMSLRVVSLLVAAILVGVHAPLLWLWLPICLFGMAVLPWLAVIIANDRPPKERYQRMSRVYGPVQDVQLVCGCHVHVGIESPDEGVVVLDRIRTRLPVVAALAANSPFWGGEDTGYASFRHQLWSRWPSAGPIEPLGDHAAYEELVKGLLGTGAAMDSGMLYFDARLAVDYPTVEVRVADVCLDVRDAVTVAGLVRALVDTAATEWRDLEPDPTPAALIRAGAWRASRYGVRDQLVDPVDRDALAAALRTVFSDEARRVALARAGSQRVDAFTWDDVTDSYEALFAQIAEKTR